ncbi:AI-2E family transporter [Listeria seeligeri]|uniref:AI-2E family transporter n=1 Tax=Listeria seeligeri TaxID=1640 RepID=UPI0010DED189|nr:AI-2E family transporter [Listeria seeligeri]MBC1480111.1 AI-2E family transporter [Listeria seeligeri]MBC1533565.1 AI-2E family transporter [Listeria seeligeri]MBC1538976.1 AI-2E family transporter [Listeria seeligeri]MBC1554363.1 AI-2E family transporter [Listeria seeligeri]MBC1721908.1 AI-2E family transporter [Listeria seeligeri]
MKLSRFRDSKLFFWTIEVLAIVAVVFILLQMKYIFSPIGIIISTLFMPILVAGFLFYLFNPLVLFLEKRKVPRILSVIIIFIAFIALIVLAIMQLGPTLADQVTELAKAIPGYWQDFEKWLQGLSNNSSLQGVDLKAELEKLNISLPKIMSVVVDGVASSFGAIVSFVSGFVMILVTVPFIVFYMFKDGHKFVESSGKFFPAAIRTEAKQIIKEMNKTISTYISSQAIDCIVVGIFTFVGYLIIGQPYALLFGLIAGATNIIPYLGPFIGAAPAVIVALFTSPLQALLVIIVVTIVQQLDSNLLSPYIMGKSLSIHPLTIIIILIVAGNLAGIFGMILGVPVYAVVKTVIVNVNRLIKLRRTELALENNPPDNPAPKI